jgi:hypothetical protein
VRCGIAAGMQPECDPELVWALLLLGGVPGLPPKEGPDGAVGCAK